MSVQQTFEVKTVAGDPLFVQSEQERTWYKRAKSSYLRDTKFTEHTDLLDLDRLLCLELLAFRWNQHLTSGVDYDEELTADEALRRKLKDAHESINKLKTTMGLTKAARTATLETGNFQDTWNELKARAKEFGIHREEQLRVALVQMNELSAIVGAFDRSDAVERAKLGYETEADILTWIREHMLPEYRKVDEHFRANSQRLWRRDVL